MSLNKRVAIIAVISCLLTIPALVSWSTSGKQPAPNVNLPKPENQIPPSYSQFQAMITVSNNAEIKKITDTVNKLSATPEKSVVIDKPGKEETLILETDDDGDCREASIITSLKAHCRVYLHGGKAGKVVPVRVYIMYWSDTPEEKLWNIKVVLNKKGQGSFTILFDPAKKPAIIGNRK